MKKSIVYLICILFCIQCIIIGCTDTTHDNIEGEENSINEEIFELAYYSIETFDSGIPWNASDETSLGSGFIHDEQADYYLIKGSIQNKLNDTVSLEVIMNFYDKDTQFLDSYTFELISILPQSYRSFTIRINEHNYEDFAQFESVTFAFEQLS